MRTTSRFIPGEQIDAVSRWSFGAVDTDALQLAAKARDEAEALRRERDAVVRQEGYAEGLTQGRAQAMADADRRVRDFVAGQGQETARRFAQLIESAEQQLGASQQAMAQGVLELACAIARQVLRQELSVNPNVLQPVIREALSVLAVDSKAAIVRLHPVDVEVLQEALETEFAGMALALVADASVKPGGCVVAASGTVVDGTLDTRWRRAVANLGLASPWEE
ncbi:MAG: flagellar assembly protein FliH [Rhodoferax sp.]|nr:flagellar assembly protein FliH [Rhodoferax sp.]